MRVYTTSDNSTYKLQNEDLKGLETIKAHCLENNIKLIDEGGKEVDLTPSKKKKD